MKHHSDYVKATSKPDIPTLARRLRTDRGLTLSDKEELRQQIRAAQAEQGIPFVNATPPESHPEQQLQI